MVLDRTWLRFNFDYPKVKEIPGAPWESLRFVSDSLLSFKHQATFGTATINIYRLDFMVNCFAVQELHGVKQVNKIIQSYSTYKRAWKCYDSAAWFVSINWRYLVWWSWLSRTMQETHPEAFGIHPEIHGAQSWSMNCSTGGFLYPIGSMGLVYLPTYAWWIFMVNTWCGRVDDILINSITEDLPHSTKLWFFHWKTQWKSTVFLEGWDPSDQKP